MDLLPKIKKTTLRLFHQLKNGLIERGPLAILRLYYLAFGCSIIAYFFQEGWFFDTLNHFKYQYLIFGVFGLVVIRPLNKVALASCAVLIVTNLPQIVPLYSTPTESPGTGPEFSVLLSNVFQLNENYSAVQDLIDRKKAEIVVIQELTPEWERQLSSTLEKYKYRKLVPLEGDFGMGVYSLLPILDAKIFWEQKDLPPRIYLKLKLQEREFGLHSVHPWPPISPRSFERRNRQLKAVGQEIEASVLPSLLVGDLNITPFSKYFKDIIRLGRLNDPRMSRGFLPTCPAFLPPIWVPCDHILVTDEFSVEKLEVENHVGSDHWPLSARVRFKS